MIECPACSVPQPEGAKFCGSCGAPLATVCVACSASLSPGARFCSECGTPVGTVAAVTGAVPTPVASRRITSVLFGDLVGFTTLSESRDQEDVRELLSRYFEECATIVARYGGVVEKFIGDAVMAVWGVPTTNEDDAERAVRAGLELVASVAALGAEVGVAELALRVGIVTGEVAVTVGAQMQGMVAGDPVNTASRVQSAAAPGQVWVDETTRLLTSSSVSYADVGSHELKGKAEPMPLWAARAVIATAGGAQRADGLEAPLVGLDRELRMVKEAYHRADESGRASLLVIAGDAGMGKSRLGWEFSKYTDGLSTGCRWHAGRCVSYGEGVAYYALAEAVRSRLETAIGLDDESLDTDALIERGLAAYADDPEERAWLAPRLGALLGTSGTSSFRRDDLYAAWTTFLERVGEGIEPVVMLIDDAHHADEGLIHFVEHLLAAAAFPCFVVMLARPELLTEHPDLVANRRSTVLHIDPLTPREMAELMDGLVEGLPADVRDELVGRAEGIPTYAVETVRALIDRDLVVPRGGAYVLADADGLDLEDIGPPASLQALISARLDRLTPAERLVVDRASVAGDSVEPGLLAELCADLGDLASVLASLVRAQILTVDHDRLSSEQGRYQFVQSAVRQVAYATLSRRERKQTHLRVLDVLTAEPTPELAPVAAEHAMAAMQAAPADPDAAELTARAVGLLRQAADRDTGLGSPTEAAAHLGRALELVGDRPERLELQLAMATACLDIGRYDEARELATEARAAFAAAGDYPREAEAAAEMARALVGGPGESQAAADLLEPYRERLSAMPDAVLSYAAVLRAYTGARGRLGTNSYELTLEALQVADRTGDGQSVVRGLANLGVQMLQSGNHLIGTILLEKSVELAREAHNLQIEGHSLATLSAAMHGEDLVRSLADARSAVEVTARAGSLDASSVARVALAAAQWASGEWNELSTPDLWDLHPDDESQGNALAGLTLFARGRDPVETVESGARREYGSHWRVLGDALVARSRNDPNAGELVCRAVATAFELGGVFDEFTSVYGAALCLVPERQGADVLDFLAQVVDGSGERLMRGLAAHRDFVEALRAAERDSGQDQVGRHFESALSGYRDWGSPVYAARASAAYAVWLRADGRGEEAAPHLAAARSAYTELGAAGWLADLDAALADNVVEA